jgi:hypothetical protein
MLVLLMATAAAAGQLVLNDTIYHVNSGLPSKGTYKCFEDTDVHSLSGVVTDASGGKISVHVANGTMPDYTITVDPARKGINVRNITMSFTCKGVPSVTKGFTYVFKTSMGEQAVQFRFAAAGGAGTIYVLLGPNPPPPPPEPAPCNLAYNHTACHAVAPAPGSKSGCAWCTSNDGVHAACYDALHEPDARTWSCDK